jgi:hypothetical protein
VKLVELLSYDIDELPRSAARQIGTELLRKLDKWNIRSYEISAKLRLVHVNMRLHARPNFDRWPDATCVVVAKIQPGFLFNRYAQDQAILIFG